MAARASVPRMCFIDSVSGYDRGTMRFDVSEDNEWRFALR
jgi:hypothetical protein